MGSIILIYENNVVQTHTACGEVLVRCTSRGVTLIDVMSVESRALQMFSSAQDPSPKILMTLIKTTCVIT